MSSASTFVKINLTRSQEAGADGLGRSVASQTVQTLEANVKASASVAVLEAAPAIFMAMGAGSPVA